MFKMLSMSVFLLLFSFHSTANSAADTVVSDEVFSRIKQSAKMKEGDILYVDFWASWCKPCRKSFPWMNYMTEKYGNKGFKVLAVNVDKERALANEFLAGVDTTFPIFYDPKGSLAEQFNLNAMPSSFILNSDGVLLKAHKGFFEDKRDAYELEIKSLLNK